ncbi:MAG: hypothetical protein R6W77_05585 [Trueperaceae bacterium]
MAASAERHVVLVSNGPGELYTWTRPVLDALRKSAPDVRVAIALVPCQFASGHEAEIAATFGADVVTTPAQYLRSAAVGAAPAPLVRPRDEGDSRGVVIGLGGNVALATALGKRLGYPVARYSFEPNWHRELTFLLVPDDEVRRRAIRGGAPASSVRVVGNLVADAAHAARPAPAPGSPHVLLFAGSRDGFAVHLIPLLIAVADRLAPTYPGARFVWPVSRLLREQTLADGIAGRHADTLGGVAGTREGDVVRTPGGAEIELVDESERYAHMRAADVAVTIPGTNTLELGVAGVPALVLLPLNRPELIPLEGVGHWLGLIPLIGRYLKRYAVRLFVQGLRVPVSLPNRITGEPLMDELSGSVDPDLVTAHLRRLIDDPDDLAARRARLKATMPAPGAADAVARIALDLAAPRTGTTK